MNNNDLEQKSTRKKYSPQFKDQALEREDGCLVYGQKSGS